MQLQWGNLSLLPKSCNKIKKYFLDEKRLYLYVQITKRNSSSVYLNLAVWVIPFFEIKWHRGQKIAWGKKKIVRFLSLHNCGRWIGMLSFMNSQFYLCRCWGICIEIGPDPIRAYFWYVVNKRPTHLWTRYFLNRLKDIFLIQREKIEKFGIFWGNFQTQTQIKDGWPDPARTTKNWPDPTWVKNFKLQYLKKIPNFSIFFP